MATKREKFEKLQTKYRSIQVELDNLRRDLIVKYGPGNQLSWATRAEQSKFEKLQQRSRKAGDKILEILDEVSPRHWRSGVPYHWICAQLSWEDAVKPLTEALSVVPPVAYGGTLAEVRRFAGVA